MLSKPAKAMDRVERLPPLNILFVLYGQLDSNSGYHAQLHAARLQALGADAVFAVPDVMYEADPEPALPGAEAPRVLPYSAVLARLGTLPFRNRQGPEVIHAWTPREVVRRFVEELRQQRPVPVVVHLEDNEEYLTAVTVGQPFAELARRPMAELDQRIPAQRYHPVRGRVFSAGAGVDGDYCDPGAL